MDFYYFNLGVYYYVLHFYYKLKSYMTLPFKCNNNFMIELCFISISTLSTNYLDLLYIHKEFAVQTEQFILNVVKRVLLLYLWFIYF